MWTTLSAAVDWKESSGKSNTLGQGVNHPGIPKFNLQIILVLNSKNSVSNSTKLK
jgi:hypothetical protein